VERGLGELCSCPGCGAPTMIQEIGFALDSPLEGNGFELPVPGREAANRDGRRTGCPEIGTDLLQNRRFESIFL
jgi:hypothetical protein